MGSHKPYSNASGSLAPSSIGAALWVVLAFPGALNAQQAARSGMAIFPADTQQVAYANFAQLRSSPDYPKIRQHVLFQQLQGFQEFLRSVGVDPERDVDEVMLGWRGESPSGPGSFGVATGRFEPDQVRRFYTETQLPVQSYAGYDLFAFGSGAEPSDTFFTFFDNSLAAFGHLPDLKAIVDIHEASAQGLDTNRTFHDDEAELEGTSPQWGIMTGKAADAAAPLLFGGKKSSVDLTVFLQTVQAVLYRVDWDGGFTAHIDIICHTPASATGIFQLLTALKSALVSSPPGGGSGTPSLLQNLDAHQDGPRIELTASGPADQLDQVLKVN
jgi:hypothetical protein